MTERSSSQNSIENSIFLFKLFGRLLPRRRESTPPSHFFYRKNLSSEAVRCICTDNNQSREHKWVACSHVPGLVFRTDVYVELTDLQLQSLAYSPDQHQFYQEARIKKAIFMGCRNGEIELGFANENQANNNMMEIEIRNWFREYFPSQLVSSNISTELIPQPSILTTGSDLLPPSSNSSSSLRSSPMDSPESAPLLFNIPINTNIQQLPSIPSLPLLYERQQPQAVVEPGISPSANIQAFGQQQNMELPRSERENAAIAEALLHVFTSSTCPPNSSSSSSVFSHRFSSGKNPRATSAFRNYSPKTSVLETRDGLSRMSMFERAISYYSRWNAARRQQMLAGRPSTTQLHHMISERRRREKLNESFQALRSLLPPGTKKDKASVLTSTREYLSSLISQIAELRRRNQLLEAEKRVMPEKQVGELGEVGVSSERFSVGLTQISESTSEERILDLQVRVRAHIPNVNLMIGILEFLKQDRNVNLMSMEANTHGATFRVIIEGSEWDKPAFEEAIRRIVADMTQ
ncbi:putative transcription factor bHLH041 [Rutidosis leptorrhynchoides]|uniref:putative transcription factor bHLH041 n=1 Tax=Rutidosis leptorrhynchoides TaxID=125765 RepID=UPI003A995B4F